jgi:hypothetical protein
MYSSAPVLAEQISGRWNLRLSQEYNMTTDRRLFNKATDGYVLYEGKMISSFDHRFSENTYWMNKEIAREEELRSYWRKLKKPSQKPKILDQSHFRMGFRSIASNTNERTLISTVLPKDVSCPHSIILARRISLNDDCTGSAELINSPQSTFLASVFNSFVCDFLIRIKVTTNLTMPFIYSLPIPRLGCADPRDSTHFWPVVARALRLFCTTDEYADLWSEVFPQIPADTLDALAAPPSAYGPAHERALRERLAESYSSLDITWSPACGLHDRKPDRRDDGDRAQTRAELDALIAHLYGLTRDEFSYILDTFPVLRRKELAAFGEYQSKRKALEEFDRFQP